MSVVLCAISISKYTFHRLTSQKQKNTEIIGQFSYMLQKDASEDGASTQQQGQHADDGHQHIKELLRIILG